MYGKHNTLWCSQLLCHVYVLWQSLNHGSLQTMGRDPQSGGRKDFKRASFPNPRMAARHQHPHWCPVPSKQGNIWLTKLHGWAQGMWYHSELCQHFKGFSEHYSYWDATIWSKERQTSGASQNYCQLLKKKRKFNENKNPYFTQVLIQWQELLVK